MDTSHNKSFSTQVILASAMVAAVSSGVTPLANAAENMPVITVTPKHEFPSMNHELTLETGESLRLGHLHKVATYRFCVDSFKGSVPLKVIVDGAESTVGVASCETVTGEHFTVGPAAKIPAGDYLVARLER